MVVVYRVVVALVEEGIGWILVEEDRTRRWRPREADSCSHWVVSTSATNKPSMYNNPSTGQ